jgi:coiled-coil domain-containing protein 130
VSPPPPVLPCPVLSCLQTIELPDANEQAAVASDPLASLERQTLQARKAASGRAQLVQLSAEREAKGRDPYSLNKTLRAAMRQTKKADAQLEAE